MTSIANAPARPSVLKHIFILAAIVFLSLLMAAAAWYYAASTGAVLTITPVFSLWFMLPLMMAALVLTVILYGWQSLMASPTQVLWLTALRLALLGLLAILLLQPTLRWVSTRVSAGTLWVIVDQSPSMQNIDAQASSAERLHWAEGMGMIHRPLRPDLLAAEARVLADEFDDLQPNASQNYGTSDNEVIKNSAARVDAWLAALKKFQDKVSDARGQLNGLSRGAGDRALDQVQSANEQAHRNLTALRNTDTITDAAAALQPGDVAPYLTRAADALATAGIAADAQYISQNAGSFGPVNNTVAADTRRDLMNQLLTGSDAPAAKPLSDLSRQYTLRVGSFSDKAQSQGTVDENSLVNVLRSSMQPSGSGQATNLAGMLQFAAQHIPADEAASVIVVTDGRTNIGGDPVGPAASLRSRGVHVYGVLIGSRELSPDAAVEPVDFPEWVFKGDSVKPRALIRLDGLQGQTARVQAYRGGTLLQEQQIRVTQAHQMTPFDFTDQPPESEKVLEYEIKVSPMQGEVNTQNNVAAFRVAIKKDKLYALIVEDRPRWEYRYLAAYFSRRPDVLKLQTVLLQPATISGVAPPPPVMASPDNKEIEATQLPVTLADWEKFDLIIIGDVGPDLITPQAQQCIAAAVRDKGATLITIAGQHAMPENYVNSAFADILPVTTNAQYSSEDITRDTRLGFHPLSAPTAGMSVLAQLGPNTDTNSRAWQGMPMWYWHSAYTQAKPAATVNWTIGGDGGGGDADDDPAQLATAGRHGLLVSMPIGLGHSLYLASDQTWRLRHVGGLNLHDRFWGQVLNWAVGSDLPAGGKYVRFGTNQPTYEQTQPVIVTARILRDDLTPYTGLDFSAVARPARSGTGPATSPDASPNPGDSVEGRFVPMASPGYYQATLTGLPIGDDEITLKGAEVERLLNSDPTVTMRNVVVKIFPTMNAERQNMNTDPDMLESIARAGGGFSVDGQYADMLLSRLPKIEHKETATHQLGFFADPNDRYTHWAHWVFLGLFVIIITLEWALRKRAGLV